MFGEGRGGESEGEERVRVRVRMRVRVRVSVRVRVMCGMRQCISTLTALAVAAATSEPPLMKVRRQGARQKVRLRTCASGDAGTTQVHATVYIGRS